MSARDLAAYACENIFSKILGKKIPTADEKEGVWQAILFLENGGVPEYTPPEREAAPEPLPEETDPEGSTPVVTAIQLHVEESAKRFADKFFSVPPIMRLVLLMKFNGKSNYEITVTLNLNPEHVLRTFSDFGLHRNHKDVTYRAFLKRAEEVVCEHDLYQGMRELAEQSKQEPSDEQVALWMRHLTPRQYKLLFQENGVTFQQFTGTETYKSNANHTIGYRYRLGLLGMPLAKAWEKIQNAHVIHKAYLRRIGIAE